jgi:hypothetical protein
LIGLNIKKAKGSKPLPEKQLKDAEKFVKSYHKQITNKWNEFFVLRKKIKIEKINKRIK